MKKKENERRRRREEEEEKEEKERQEEEKKKEKERKKLMKNIVKDMKYLKNLKITSKKVIENKIYYCDNFALFDKINNMLIREDFITDYHLALYIRKYISMNFSLKTNG